VEPEGDPVELPTQPDGCHGQGRPGQRQRGAVEDHVGTHQEEQTRDRGVVVEVPPPPGAPISDAERCRVAGRAQKHECDAERCRVHAVEEHHPDRSAEADQESRSAL
jgi:hypothetical protein